MGQNVSRLAPRKGQGAALLRATRHGDVERVENILECAPAASAYCTLEGLTPLHVAAGARRADLLERLLIALRQAGRKAGRKLNQKNVHGQTPLMLACKAGAADCVRLLLEAGADATLFDDLSQRTCLHYAALYGWAEALEALLEDESVVRGAQGGGQPLRDALLADSQGHHKYIDGRDGLGLAALHLAASQGHLAAVKVLLKRGACLAVRCNVAFNLGSTEPWTPCSTPLHFAAAGRGRVVQALLLAAADRERRARLEGREAPDVRLLQDFRGNRPYDIALGLGFRSIAWALNPRVPLESLVQRAAAARGLPSLAALAAAALRRRLTARLGEVEGEVVEARNNCVAAEEEQHARRGGGSRRGGRAPGEGSAHGGAAFAALLAAAAAQPPQAVQSARASSRQGAGAGAGRHSRHASDGGLGSSLHSVQLPPPVAGSPATQIPAGGSWRGGAVYEALCLGGSLGGAGAGAPELLLPLPLPGAASPRGPSPAPAALLSAAEASYASCALSATSVTSVAGCPVCLDSRLEVAVAPCGHGLCLGCALHLTREEEGCGGPLAAGPVLPLCPLCRGLMGDFRALPACF